MEGNIHLPLNWAPITFLIHGPILVYQLAKHNSEKTKGRTRERRGGEAESDVKSKNCSTKAIDRNDGDTQPAELCVERGGR